MEEQDPTKSILKEFDSKEILFKSFAEICERLVREILNANGFHVHNINSRVKERSKLKEKIERKDYHSLEDATDLIGVRIITNFEDDVDKIATVIEREFLIDQANSIDKRKTLDPDKFGYLSLHYVCSIDANRGNLVEYKKYSGLVCEIQIRSILQHTWAEIEHDLGYKSGATIPHLARRRFSRLAGLLELADIEFTGIRDQLAQYSIRVEQDILQKPSQVLLDDVSLAAFIKSDSLIVEMDKEMVRPFDGQIVNRENVQKLTEQLHYVGLRTISEVRAALKSRRALILAESRKRVNEVKGKSIRRGVSLYHLFQVMVVQQSGVNGLEEAFDKFRIISPQERKQAAMKIVEIINALQDSDTKR